MTLSPELQARYTTEVDVDWWDALILSHSTGGTFYLTNSHQSEQAVFDGALRTFLPIPFSAKLPTLDGEGQQDLTIAVCNVGQEMREAMRRVKQRPEEPIRCQYTVYIRGNQSPQYNPPFELFLNSLELTVSQLSGVASRVDVFNLPFPRRLYRIDEFPALERR